MTLQEMYPKEWGELTNKKVPKKRIDEYLLKFVARLLREVKEGKREDIDLGDGFSIGKLAMKKESGYKLSPELNKLLEWLSDYRVEFPDGATVWGAPQTPEEVEKELKKVAKKLGIKLNI